LKKIPIETIYYVWLVLVITYISYELKLYVIDFVLLIKRQKSREKNNKKFRNLAQVSINNLV